MVTSYRIKDWETNDRALISLFGYGYVATYEERHLIANKIRKDYFTILYRINGSRFASTIEGAYARVFGEQIKRVKSVVS